MKTVIADDIQFEQEPRLGAFRVHVIARGEIAVEILIAASTMQKAIGDAMAAVAVREERACNVVSFK